MGENFDPNPFKIVNLTPKYLKIVSTHILSIMHACQWLHKDIKILNWFGQSDLVGMHFLGLYELKGNLKLLPRI
jgi:hypothetical protein